jgi:hypothetical protein
MPGRECQLDLVDTLHDKKALAATITAAGSKLDQPLDTAVLEACDVH